MRFIPYILFIVFIPNLLFSQNHTRLILNSTGNFYAKNIVIHEQDTSVNSSTDSWYNYRNKPLNDCFNQVFRQDNNNLPSFITFLKIKAGVPLLSTLKANPNTNPKQFNFRYYRIRFNEKYTCGYKPEPLNDSLNRFFTPDSVYLVIAAFTDTGKQTIFAPFTIPIQFNILLFNGKTPKSNIGKIMNLGSINAVTNQLPHQLYSKLLIHSFRTDWRAEGYAYCLRRVNIQTPCYLNITPHDESELYVFDDHYIIFGKITNPDSLVNACITKPRSKTYLYPHYYFKDTGTYSILSVYRILHNIYDYKNELETESCWKKTQEMKEYMKFSFSDKVIYGNNFEPGHAFEIQYQDFSSAYSSYSYYPICQDPNNLINTSIKPYCPEKLLESAFNNKSQFYYYVFHTPPGKKMLSGKNILIFKGSSLKKPDNCTSSKHFLKYTYRSIISDEVTYKLKGNSDYTIVSAEPINKLTIHSISSGTGNNLLEFTDNCLSVGLSILLGACGTAGALYYLFP